MPGPVILPAVVLVWYDGIAVDWPPLVRAWLPDTFFGNAGVALWWWARRMEACSKES